MINDNFSVQHNRKVNSVVQSFRDLPSNFNGVETAPERLLILETYSLHVVRLEKWKGRVHVVL